METSQAEAEPRGPAWVAVFNTELAKSVGVVDNSSFFLSRIFNPTKLLGAPAWLPCKWVNGVAANI